MTASFAPPTDATPARPGIADRLAAMIAVPTVSGSGDAESGPFVELRRLLAELYPLVHEKLSCELFADHGMIFTWTAPGEADPVVLLAHLDVVPVAGQEAEWTVPPFEGRISDGQVWGRGALDDKGALCTLLEAVENLLAEGWTPPRTVLICLGPDEEVNGATASRMATSVAERGVRPWLVLDEGGAITEIPFPGVEGCFAVIGLAEKGVVNIELSCQGTGGHASAPDGLTAVGRISRAVSRLNQNPFAVQMPKTVANLIATLAEHAEPRYARAWRMAARYRWLTAKLLATVGGPDGAAMVRTSLAATMVSGGSGANVLPSAASATLNLRVNVGESIAGVVARLRRVIADPKVEVRVLAGDEPSPESASDSEQFELIAASVAASYPGVACLPYLTMAATDARHWHRFAPAVFRFAPLYIPGAERAGIHGRDERVRIDSLVRGERCYRALLQGIPE